MNALGRQTLWHILKCKFHFVVCCRNGENGRYFCVDSFILVFFKYFSRFFFFIYHTHYRFAVFLSASIHLDRRSHNCTHVPVANWNHLRICTYIHSFDDSKSVRGAVDSVQLRIPEHNSKSIHK